VRDHLEDQDVEGRIVLKQIYRTIMSKNIK
jgi:hypothetical protein